MGRSSHQKFPLVFALLLAIALVQRHLFAAKNDKMDPSLWTSPSNSSNNKGGGSRGNGGKNQVPIGGGGQKGQKRSQSGGPKGGDSSGAGGGKPPRQAKGGYTFGTDSLKPRLPPQTFPWGTGATKANLELFSNGSEYPGLAQSADHSTSSVPVLCDWYPCLNERCPAPSRKTPPFSRAGVSNFAVVSNSQVKCKFCYVQYLPVNSQRVIAMFQAPLVEQLGGSLGALHPKFAGSKLYGQAELALLTNESNYDPNKPPVFAEGTFSLPSPAEWLEANTSIGKVQRNRSGTSQEVVLAAKASLARLDNATANGEVALDFAKLSRATSAASLAPTSTQDPDASSSYCTPDVGIFRYLQTAIDNAKNTGEDALAAALESKLHKDFPNGEPEPPKAPAPPTLSAPNELNLLATKSAQTLRELLASRANLDLAKDKVISCQSALNEAKEAATKAAAQVAIAASNYEQAGLAVKDFNDKVQQTELAAAAAASAELTEATLKIPKVETKTEDPKDPTYAAVVKGISKGKPSNTAAPVLPPMQSTRKAEEEPDMDGDKAMGGASNSGSQQTSASKRQKNLPMHRSRSGSTTTLRRANCF